MFGPHVNRGRSASIAGAIEAARHAAAAEGFQMTAAQIFVSEPRRPVINLRDGEAEALRRLENVRVVAHCSYVTHAWKGTKHIHAEQRACQAAGISGLVLHLPKDLDVALLRDIVDPLSPDVIIYLETPALVRSPYDSPGKLAQLYAAIRGLGVADRFGFCVDTAHLWTSGVDLSSRESAEAWISAYEALQAAGQLPAALMLHCNDSGRPRGRGPDEHAPLCRGQIWSGYMESPADSGLAAFVAFAARTNAVLILERHDSHGLESDYELLLRVRPSLRA
jgi:endonuclease IV